MTIDAEGHLSTRFKALFASPFVGWYAIRYFKTSFMKLYYTDQLSSSGC